MATNMIEIATLPINVPVAPTAAGIMVDPRTKQIIYNTDGILRYMPAMLAVATDQVVSTATAKTTYQSYTIPLNAVTVPGRCLRILHFGTCAATAGVKTITIDVNRTQVATTGAVANNAGAWRLMVDLVVTSTTTALASGIGNSAATSATSFVTAVPLGATQIIEFTSTNAALGDTTHCGYILQLVG